MAKPKLKPEIKTETLVSAAPKWNVVVLNDPINYQAYVVVAFMSVLRISAAEAKKLIEDSGLKVYSAIMLQEAADLVRQHVG